MQQHDPHIFNICEDLKVTAACDDMAAVSPHAQGFTLRRRFVSLSVAKTGLSHRAEDSLTTYYGQTALKARRIKMTHGFASYVTR